MFQPATTRGQESSENDKSSSDNFFLTMCKARMPHYGNNASNGRQQPQHKHAVASHFSVKIHGFWMLDRRRAFQHFKRLKLVSRERLEMELRQMHFTPALSPCMMHNCRMANKAFGSFWSAAKDSNLKPLCWFSSLFSQPIPSTSICPRNAWAGTYQQK